MERDSKRAGSPATKPSRSSSASRTFSPTARSFALEAIIADQIRETMKAKGLSTTAMAARMGADRRQLDRLLDAKNPTVTHATLRRAASAVGGTLRVELA